MKFIDEAIIRVQAGKGGSGCKHFHREKFVQLGGPDGGNGGRGGSIILTADSNKNTLLDFKYRPMWAAQNGKAGEPSCRDGRRGEDLVIRVPVGTQVLKCGSGTTGPSESSLVADLSRDGQSIVLAQGGRGGKGNAFFKSPTNRTPEHFQPGEPGEEGVFLLSLKLVADIGLIGLPNAGKSTLISRISAARPKIADYPFTTLIPNLGVIRIDKERALVVADIPGLVPGAHAGKGLGIKFLKHIERTRFLAHLIDAQGVDSNGNIVEPFESFEQVNLELQTFSDVLASKPQVVVITKIDTLHDRSALYRAISDFESMGFKCLGISSVAGEGIDILINTFAQMIFSEGK